MEWYSAKAQGQLYLYSTANNKFLSVLFKVVIFFVVTPCNVVEDTKVSEVHAASICAVRMFGMPTQPYTASQHRRLQLEYSLS
jgi:hypothetical protein